MFLSLVSRLYSLLKHHIQAHLSDNIAVPRMIWLGVKGSEWSRSVQAHLLRTSSRSSPANWWLPLASLDVDYERLIPLSSRDISKVAVDFSLLYRIVQVD